MNSANSPHTINIQTHLTMTADTTSRRDCTGDIRLLGNKNTNGI